MQFPISIETVPVRVRFKKPTPRTEMVDWPVIRMSSWICALTKECPEYLLGGLQLADVDGWKMLFSGFWNQYKLIDPAHPIFSANVDTASVVPYALHGDEGRGLRGKPYLVESWQPIIGVGGPFKTNESGLLI